jgi:hypothetical protein
LITISSLIAFGFKKPTVVLLLGLLLFAMTIPSFIILGLDVSYFLLSIDYCKDINKYMTSSALIVDRGLGYFISCPSKTAQFNINTARYELSTSFENLYKNINQLLIDEMGVKEGLGPYKRFNNRYYKLLNDNKFPEDKVYIARGLQMLIETNDILRNLEAMGQCQAARNVINFGEDHFCHRNIGFQFSNLIFLFFGILSVIILSIGINKLTVLLNPNVTTKRVSFRCLLLV